MNGRLIYNQILMDKNGVVIVNNLDQLQAGVYFIKIEINSILGETVMKRLIKY